MTLTTPAELPRTQGLLAVSWAIGLTLGPVIGGAFAENHKATWRWVSISSRRKSLQKG